MGEYMKEYHSLKELFAMADAEHVSPGIIACRLEAEQTGKSYKEVWYKMKKTIPVFMHSIREGLHDTELSASGLVGGDAARLYNTKPLFLGTVAHRAASFAVATAEANAKMMRIVACPTAGSCGIVPAVVAAVGEMVGAGIEDYTRVLFTAGAVGHVVAENASIAGAVGGCQAECGTAAGMAAAAAVDLLHGTTEQMGNAIALALKNLLGLVCDPVAGLVEVPCVKRNGFEAVHTLVAVEMAMAGIKTRIPPDEVISALDEVGRLIPVSLRETSQAGLAQTETGKRIQEEMDRRNRE
jgi:L-serine dehydratase